MIAARANRTLVFAALVVGCGSSQTIVSEAPIPIGLTGNNGGLLAYGTLNSGAPFPLLVDTGTVLTSHGAVGDALVTHGDLRLLGRFPDGRVDVERALFGDTAILLTPLGQVGENDQVVDLAQGGVLAGDLLSYFSLALDYTPSAPSISLLPSDISCSCQLARDCKAVLPFSLSGGGTFALGDQVLTYPPTRVTLDVCLQPLRDPQHALGQTCLVGSGDNLQFNSAYYDVNGRPGVDARLLVATGFSGLLLGASAYERLAGSDATAQLLSAPTERLYFPGRPDPVRAARATLPIAGAGSELAAIALVDRLGLLGPCGELSRSRRLRAVDSTVEKFNLPDCEAGDPDYDKSHPSCLQLLSGDTSSNACVDAHGTGRCNDRNQSAAAFVEIDDPIPIYVAPDTAPILQEVNFDVQPGLSAVEGVVGTELLARLRMRLDYPNSRMEVECASSGCSAFPQLGCYHTSLLDPDVTETGDCKARGQDPTLVCVRPQDVSARAAVDGGVSACFAPMSAAPTDGGATD